MSLKKETVLNREAAGRARRANRPAGWEKVETRGPLFQVEMFGQPEPEKEKVTKQKDGSSALIDFKETTSNISIRKPYVEN